MKWSDLAHRALSAASGPVGSYGWAKAMFEAVYPPKPTAQELQVRDHIASYLARQSGHQVSAPSRLPPFGEPAMDPSGRLVKLADSDDSTQLACADASEAVRLVREAQLVFASLCEDETGLAVDPALKDKKDAERAALRAQSHAIAAKLESAGVPAYRSSEWILWTYGIHSGEVEVIPQFRRVAFVPFVAAAIREPFVRALEFWLQRNPFDRFWTLTGGPRVRLRDVRKAVRRLSARIRRLNAQPFMRRAGVRVVFRSIELGSVEETRLDTLANTAGRIERDESGELWFHPHAHCLVHLERGRLTKRDWSAFLCELRAWWGDWMDDGGVIRNVREAVKYVTKPAEIEQLTPAETAALFAQLRRAKLVQPLGALAEQIKARKAAGLTLLRERTEDGYLWREVRDWNRHAARRRARVPVLLRAESPEEAALSESLGALGPNCGGVSEMDMDAALRLDARRRGGAVDACHVVATCAPSAASNCLKEPRVIVMGRRWDAAAVDAHPLVVRLREQTAAAWAAGLALIRVHTGTPSVRACAPPRTFTFMADVTERSAPPGVPVFSR